jgi:aminopeptidase-like protein
MKASLERQMHVLIKRLYPVCRSITGMGVRETFLILRR